MKSVQERQKELHLVILFATVASIFIVIFGAIGIYDMQMMYGGSGAYIIVFLFMLVSIAAYIYVYKVLKKYSVQISNQEEELSHSNIRLEYAISGTGDGLWDWDILKGEVYFSPRWKKMLGFEDDELPSEFASWEDRVHPDDLQTALQEITNAHTDPEYDYNTIHRLRHKDGSWVWILDRGKTIFDENKKAVRMVGFHTDITTMKNQEIKNKKLENDLKASKELFEKFMEYIPANISIFENGVVLYANKDTNAFFGEESIVGCRVDDLLFKDDKSNMIQNSFSRALSEGGYEDIVKVQNHLNENKIYREFAFKIEDELHSKVGLVSIDITKEYQSNKEIKRVLSAFERSNISVLMTNLLGDIEYVNPSWCKITGYSKDELIGQNPRIVKSGYISSETYIKMWGQLTKGRIWNSEIKNVAKDGTEFWEDSTIMPSFNQDGEIDGYIAFKLEINEKIRLKQELHDKDEIMIAQSRHAAMGEMISMIAHQWRQPISVIAIDASNILADVELESINEEFLREVSGRIINQTQELSKTIDDFRDFFKPDKVAEDVLVQKIIDDTMAVIGKSLENSSIEIRLEISQELQIKTYSRELMQVLINIIKNAKEAFEPLAKEEKTISITVKQESDTIEVKIMDNAGGVDKTIIKQIFDPYFTTKGVKNGTGLGLYMSKTIVEKHLRGILDVYNNNEGACFSIKLPLSIHHG